MKYWDLFATGLAAGLILLLLTSCETANVTGHARGGKARVTFYNPYERDRVRVRRGHRYVWRWIRWGRRTAAGVRAVEGVTLAAPKQIPFGTRVCIPQLKGVVGTGEFVVQDRGAGAKLFHTNEWFDVFVSNTYRMKQLAIGLPEYLEYKLQ